MCILGWVLVMLDGEMLVVFGVMGVMLVIYLLVYVLDWVWVEFVLYYGVDCLVVVVFCVSWFD